MCERIDKHLQKLVRRANDGKNRVLLLADRLVRTIRKQNIPEYIVDYSLFTTNLFLLYMSGMCEIVFTICETLPYSWDYTLEDLEYIEAVDSLSGVDNLQTYLSVLLYETCKTIECFSGRLYVDEHYRYFLVMRNLLSANKYMSDYGRVLRLIKDQTFFKWLSYPRYPVPMLKYNLHEQKGYFLKNCLSLLSYL